MGDVGDYWRDVTSAQQQTRRERQEEATAAIGRLRTQLSFLGVALRVCREDHWQFWSHGGRLIGEYWPTTQKARPANGTTHHGVSLTQIVAWVKNRA